PALLASTLTVPAFAQEIAGPPSPIWTAPDCATIIGTASVTYTTDDGATLTPTNRPLSGTSYTLGLVALETPNTLLAAVGSHILRSTDAGCHWTPLANLGRETGNALLTLTAAPGGRAYAWAENQGVLFRIDGRTVTALKAPVTAIIGFGADAKNGGFVRLADTSGQVWESFDAGATWSPLGSPAREGVFAYRAAFDPSNLDHIVVGTMVNGAFVTFDASRTWTQSIGITKGIANVFNVVVSPADPRVVWAQGLDITEADAGAPSGGRHIYRSIDGGLTFGAAVDQGAGVTLVNGTYMAAPPSNPDVVYFVFGTSFGNYGTDLYKYDAAAGQVTWTHNGYDEIGAIAFSPASPSLLYLGLVSEQIQ
ncbi:MAG: WD40/YVTN/BNR-like repeat-containing protein, partial [Thermoanaerobaculia bacterium]